MIIPIERREPSTLHGPQVLKHRDMELAYRWIIEEYKPPVKDLCIFIPCSIRKPYRFSPSHKLYHRIIYGIADKNHVHIVVFGTCGVVPSELDTEYPFDSYRFVVGNAEKSVQREFVRIETHRLKEYLIKTQKNYKNRIAYCLGVFREAMKNAVRDAEKITSTPLNMTIVPYPTTINRIYNPNLRFPEGSLMMPEYIQDFADAIAEALKKRKRRVGTITAESPDDINIGFID